MDRGACRATVHGVARVVHDLATKPSSIYIYFCCSVTKYKSCPTLQPHGLQYAKFFCPPLSPGVCSNSCLLSWWCYLNILFFCHPLVLLPSIFCRIKVLSNESALSIKWPKFLRSNFSISSSNEYSVLISFRIDWFDPFAVQGTLKSLLQHHNLKESILWCSILLYVPTLIFIHYYWSLYMKVYGERCQVWDLLSRRFSFGTGEQAWSLNQFCVTKFY